MFNKRKTPEQTSVDSERTAHSESNTASENPEPAFKIQYEEHSNDWCKYKDQR